MKVTYEKNEVIIRIPVTDATIAAAPATRTGKSVMLATTSGFIAVDGAPAGVKLGLNLIGPKKS